MLLPIGVLLPMAMSGSENGTKRIFRRAIWVGFPTSLTIEVLQLIMRRGLFEFDDMFHNTLGVAIGYTALWQTVIAYQNYLFHTSSGLPFSYTVKRKKNGEYGGELIVSRKEGSRTLDRSSVMLAFHIVLKGITTVDVLDTDERETENRLQVKK